MRKALFGIVAVLMVLCAGGWYTPKDFGEFPKSCNPDSWVKRGIVIEPNQPWEGGSIQNFNSPTEALGDGRWRIWYGFWGSTASYGSGMNIAMAEGVPGGKWSKHVAVLTEGEPADAPLAIGNLPEGWRPVHPVHIKLKDGRDRLYFWVHAPKQGVIRYLAAESTDGRRYRVVNPHTPCLYHFFDRAIEFVGTIPSGLTLTLEDKKYRKSKPPRPACEPIADPNLISNDATVVYQLSDGTFEMYTVALVSIDKNDPRYESQTHDNLKGYIRVIDRLVSEDGLNWHSRCRVLEPDANDPVDLQFYYLNVTHTPKGRVGMLGHYRLYAQETDLEWCYSKDGIHWVRPYRKAWIERGKPYENDSYAIYTASSLINYNNQWWLFCTGTNYAHNIKCSYGRPQSVIMLATTNSIWGE
ncbi:MAG: hypothetical protein JXB29_10800 [Sedimentisphaerales bacterium]|nr:hypothetical protein [Sedimentisphaerales bacterium]